jgi:hypothetical protein
MCLFTSYDFAYINFKMQTDCILCNVVTSRELSEPKFLSFFPS